MSNPATALADLLEKWELKPGKSVAQTRPGSAATLTFWRRQARAVELVRAVERAADALEQTGENVDDTREYLVFVYKAVFGFEPQWQRGRQTAAGPAPAVDVHALKHLRQFGRLLDKANLVEKIDRSATEKIRVALDQARDLVEEMGASVPESSRLYLFDLIADARRFVDEVDVFGAGRVRSSTMAVGAELNLQKIREEESGEPGAPARAMRIGTVLSTLVLALSAGFGTQVGELSAKWATKTMKEIVAEQGIGNADGVPNEGPEG